ncbi:MAG: chromosome condensation protein CrcB, partial [Mesorhizobium sp.]
MRTYLKTMIAGAAMLMTVVLPAAASDGVVTV